MRGMIMMNSEALNTKQKLDFLIGLWGIKSTGAARFLSRNSEAR
jgi:hypothetical protein